MEKGGLHCMSVLNVCSRQVCLQRGMSYRESVSEKPLRQQVSYIKALVVCHIFIVRIVTAQAKRLQKVEFVFENLTINNVKASRYLVEFSTRPSSVSFQAFVSFPIVCVRFQLSSLSGQKSVVDFMSGNTEQGCLNIT